MHMLVEATYTVNKSKLVDYIHKLHVLRLGDSPGRIVLWVSDMYVQNPTQHKKTYQTQNWKGS